MTAPTEPTDRSPHLTLPDGPPFSRRLVVAFCVLLLLVAVECVAAAVIVSVWSSAGIGDAGAQYVCPMHPEAHAPAPGPCPGLALSPSIRPPAKVPLRPAPRSTSPR